MLFGNRNVRLASDFIDGSFISDGKIRILGPCVSDEGKMRFFIPIHGTDPFSTHELTKIVGLDIIDENGKWKMRQAQYSAREVRGYPRIAEVAIEGLLTKLVVETVNEYRAQCRFRRARAKEDFADIVYPKQKEEVSGDASGELSPL